MIVNSLKYHTLKSNRSAALRLSHILSQSLTERVHFSIPSSFVFENERKYLFMEYIKKNHFHFHFYFISACEKKPDDFSLILVWRWQRQHQTTLLDIFRLSIVTVVWISKLTQVTHPVCVRDRADRWRWCTCNLLWSNKRL
jgi:hypothetical protein